MISYPTVRINAINYKGKRIQRVTYTSDDECQVQRGIKVLDRRVQSRWKGVFEKPSNVWVFELRFQITNDFL